MLSWSTSLSYYTSSFRFWCLLQILFTRLSYLSDAIVTAEMNIPVIVATAPTDIPTFLFLLLPLLLLLE